ERSAFLGPRDKPGDDDQEKGLSGDPSRGYRHLQVPSVGTRSDPLDQDPGVNALNLELAMNSLRRLCAGVLVGCLSLLPAGAALAQTPAAAPEPPSRDGQHD